MIPLRPMRALLLLMVLISVGQASVMASANGGSTSTSVAAAAAATTSASKHDGGGATWSPSSASPSTTAAAVQQHHPSVDPGQHLPDGVILITEFASPASTFPSAETAATSNQTTRPNGLSANADNDDISAIDEQLVLTEKVINFDAESTAPPLNELTGNGAVARDPNNGLFRIKIAEIITDEFDNGLMGADRMDAEAAAYDQQRRIAAYQNAGKIKLTDLYPSKLEDFGPIIRQSNERLINDKHVFVQDDGDDEAAARRADDEELRGHVVLNSYEPEADADDIMRPGRGGSMSRMPTTKIEIELIDDVDEPVAAAPVEGKVSDFTRELLRDNDGVINTIERSFVNVSPQRGDGERVVAVGGSINKALDAGGFIERRVKKLDPMAMGKNTPVEHAAAHEEKPEETEEHSNKEKPEFSTTKFYNSKEMSDLMHKKQEEVVLDDVKTTTSDPVVVVVTQAETEATPSAATVLTTTHVADKAKTFNINTPKAANKLKKVAKKILAVSKPLKVKTTMKATVETPSTTALPSSSLAPNTVPPTQISEDATPLATAKERPPTTILTTTAATETSSSASEGTTPTSSASPPLTDATSTSVSLTTTTTQTLRNAAMVRPPVHVALPAAAEPSTHRPVMVAAMHVPSALSRLQEKLNVLECDMPGELAPDVNVWRGNETHELNLPNTIPENCSAGADCMPMVISWEGTTEIQSGDVLIVEIDDSLLVPDDNRTNKGEQNSHKVNTAVYQVTRPGHEHCDVTEGVLLDITPLEVDGKKLVTLYDKDLTEGVNLLIVVSELWGQQCVRLKVTVKSDNCGESADCSGKGVCYSNASMEGYECQCCTGFAGPHCEEIDACSPSPCTNNGICVDLSQGHEGNAYQCLCPYGYAGKNCQFETDPCNPSECQNGGSCSGNATHFRCDCAPGFSGPLCQHNQNECESSPCVHGICVDQEDGFRCFCQPGFAGELCNFEYNECESNPCLNGGQCADHIGGFACKCTRGYSGKRCHIKVDFCANNPCPEGHRCNDRGDDYTCECPGGRNGPDCNQVPRTLCNINPCANGGTCWTSEESFYCACRPGYTGKMCEDEFIVETVVSSNEMLSDDSALARPFGEASYSAVVAAKEHSGGLHNAYVAVGTFATAIVIVVAVVAGCHCKFNQTYRRFAAAASRSSNQLLPTFAFSRRSQKQSANHRHWLSGKGADRVLAGSNVNLSQSVPHHLLHKSATSAQPFNSTGAALQQLHQQQMQHNQLLQRQQHQQQQQQQQHHGPQSSAQQVPQQHQSTCLAHPGQMQRPQFNRHLAMNLENDMYYTVDFSESQQSPLIQ